MSIDKSLIPKDPLKRHRNVLSRFERILNLEKAGRWKSGDSVFHLPKIRTAVRAKKKPRKEEKPAEAAAITSEEAPPTASTKPASAKAETSARDESRRVEKAAPAKPQKKS